MQQFSTTVHSTLGDVSPSPLPDVQQSGWCDLTLLVPCHENLKKKRLEIAALMYS